MRVRAHFAAIFLILAFCLPVHGQHQRLGLRAEAPFTLEGKGDSHFTEAYCLDKHLTITEKPVTYSHVVSEGVSADVQVGNRTMSLQRAITEGFILAMGSAESKAEFEGQGGTGIQMRFVNNTDQAVTITIHEAIAFGEQKESLIEHNSPALQVLNKPQDRYSPLFDQLTVWDKLEGERQLQMLGYYPSLAVNPKNTRAATQKFQKAKGLPVSGSLDEPTIKVLTQEEDKLIARFAKVGFNLTPLNLSRLEDPLKRYQEATGESSTGVMSPELEKRLRADELLLAEIQGLTLKTTGPDASLVGKNFPHVLTFFRDKKTTNILVGPTEKPEMWVFADDEVKRFKAGSDSVSEFSGMSTAASTSRVSHATPILVTEIYRAADSVPIWLGGKKVEISQEELKDFVEGDGKPPKMDELIIGLTTAAKTRPRVLVERSPLQQGRTSKQTIESAGFAQVDSMQFLTALQKKYGEIVDFYLAGELELGLVNVRNVPKFEKGSQMTVLVDRKRIGDFDIVDNIREQLKDADIHVVEARKGRPRETNVVLFAGHNSIELRKLLERMASDGQFKNAFLALAKCGQGDDAAFVSHLIHVSGARAVLFYDREINAQAVEDVLLRFSQNLMDHGVPNGQFQELWRRSVDEALNSESTTGEHRKNVELLKNAMIQVSEEFVKAPGMAG